MSSYEFETHQPVDLYVEIGKGSVTVDTVDTAETAGTTVHVQGRESEDVVVRQDGNQVSVIAPQHRNGIFGGEQSYAVSVTLPVHSNAVIKTGSADITLQGTYGLGQVKTGSGDCRLAVFDGPLLVETGSGDVELERAGAELRVKSGSGDVAVQHTDGAVSISTGSGDVEIRKTKGPTVVKTGSGDLEIQEAHDSVSMSTGSGDMKIASAVRGKVSAKGASGDVQIGIPAGVPVWTDLTTVSGAIQSNLRGGGQPEPGADYVELRAKTVSGDILLQEV